MKAMQCGRCKQLKSVTEVKERWFKFSFNENLCDECFNEMLERKTVLKCKGDDKMYMYDFEKLIQRMIENDRIISRNEKEIEYRMLKNKRLLKIIRTLRPDVEF